MKEILSMIILVVLLIGVASGTASNNSSYDTVTGMSPKGGCNGRG